MSQMSKHPTMTLESALCILCPDEKMVVCIIDEKKKIQNNIKTQNQWEKMNLALSLKNKHHFHFQY